MMAGAATMMVSQMARSAARFAILTVQRSAGPMKVLVVWVAHVSGKP